MKNVLWFALLGKLAPLLLGALVLLLLSQCGCGGSPAPGPNAIIVADNAQLSQLWTQAQDGIATRDIWLNAAAVAVDHVTPDIFPPDPRALGVSNVGITVTPVPDKNGAIPCPGNAEGAALCHAYVIGNAVFVAESLLSTAPEYEFENVILEKLGYDISKR